MGDIVFDEALDAYTIDRLLGRGSMGEVFRGRHVQLDRTVAIKRLPPRFAAEAAVRSRFADEAKLLASLDHPHVVPVHDYVERDGLCVVVMQELRGGTLWDLFVGSGVSMATACAVGLSVCAGLAHAHERRVVHRDIKPANLMFDEHRQLKVTDFGLAAVLVGDGTMMSPTGEVVGTPAYMAPEQADGSVIGPPADIYATATVLYELLSGRLPFDEDGDLLARRIDDEPLPLELVAPGVPIPIAQAIMAGLARDPMARPRSAEQFGIDLARAAVAAWGPTWLDLAEVRVLAGERIMAPASARDGLSASSRQPDSGAVGDLRDPGRETIARGVAPTPPPRPTAAVQLVQPAVSSHTGGPDLMALAPRDLQPIRRRHPGTQAAVGAGALAVLLCISMWVTAFSEPVGRPEPATRPGQLLLNGTDTSSGRPTGIDLAEPIAVVLGTSTPGASTVQLRFSVSGLPIGSSNEQALAAGDGGIGAVVSATSVRVATSGVVSATAVVRAADGSELDELPAVEIRPERPVWSSLAGWANALLTGLVIGYGSSLARPLWRGRRRLRSFVGLALIGAVGGAVLTLWSWVLGGPEPTLAGAVLPAILGAGGFGVGGVAVAGIGRHRLRARRARSRARRARSEVDVGR